MCKRILSCVFSAALIISLLLQPLAVSARASSVAFTLATTNGGVGETITVSLSISADSYFTNATIYLHYDAAAVQFVEEAKGGAASNSAMLLCGDHSDKGYVTAAYAGASSVKKEGILINYTFKVLKKTPAVFSVTFAECMGEDESGNMFDLTYTTSGCVANNDNSVTAPTGGNSSKSTTTTKSSAKATTTKSTAKTTAKNGATTTTKAGQTTSGITTTKVVIPTDANGVTVPTTIIVENGTSVAVASDPALRTSISEQQETTTTDPSASTDMITDMTGISVNDDEESSGSNTAVILIVVLLGVAAAAVAVLMAIKKRKTSSDDNATLAEEATPSEDKTPSDPTE